MKAELLTIGDEILIGQIVNTNAVFLAKALNKIGIEVVQITSISDSKEAIIAALEAAKTRADIILMTGGLGPTKDDLTKHTLCSYFDDVLVKNTTVLARIEEMFAKYVQTPINDENRKQALLPSKARILENLHGTASGMWFEKEGTVFISLPGVPFEMKALMTHQVIPALKSHFKRPYILHKTVLTHGLGESAIAERIQDWEAALPAAIKLAYLPNLGRVRLRLSSKGNDENELKAQIDAQIEALLPLISEIVVGFEEDASIEEQLQAQFIKKQRTLALAESCTGGAIAARLSALPGASKYFKGSAVVYHTQSKTQLLGVPEALIQEHTVVSKEVAESMAVQVRKKFQSHIGVSTTGNAGPTRGDSPAELGTVWIAIATEKGVQSHHFLFGKHRERVVEKAVSKVFELLMKEDLF